MCELVKFVKEVNLKDYTLIIPSVSVGNVGQLTVDLLITTFSFEKVATFWHPAIIASIGADPFDDGNEDVCLACELYVNQDLKIATIQLRSSLEFALALSFFRELDAFITKSNFQQVILLSSSFAHLLADPKSIFYYLSNHKAHEELLKESHFQLLKPSLNDKYIVEGSGFCLKLYEILSGHLNCTILFKYVSEGDNRNDAVSMIDILRKLLKKLDGKETQLKCPLSWNFVFGNPSPVTIF